MKICVTCKKELDFDKFGWRTKNKVRQSSCKDCQRELSRKWYSENKERHKSNVAEYSSSHRDDHARWLIDYFKSHPCVDCGETNPLTLEFDHIDPSKKTMEVSALVSYNDRLLIENEVAKCEVRCASCHRIKTAQQCNWRMYHILKDMK